MHLTSDPARAAGHVLPARQLARAWVSLAVGIALVLVFALDRGTGAAPVQHLYYLPIVLSSVRFGYRGSVSAGAAAILLYHVANPHVLTFRYEELDLLQMALFVAVGVTAAKLSNDARRLRRLAITDDLTGLHNLRSLEAHLARLVRAARQGSPLALLVLDVDRLKALNDTYGHLAGADAVRMVGRIIAERVPADAIACRYGGDEFVIALPQCSESQAVRTAEGLRRAINETAPVLAGVSLPAGTLSISIGVACRAFDRSGPADAAHESVSDDVLGERLFRAADAALYAAKAGGRNRVAASTAIANSHGAAAGRSGQLSS